MKLYEYSVTRSIRCHWLLEEIGAPYESVNVDLATGEHEQPEFLKINPLGKVPALQDGKLNLFESAAICNYIADKYPEAGLIPKVGTIERALHDQWMYFCMAELEQPLWTIAKHTFVYDESEQSPAARELAAKDFRKIVKPLEKHMSDRTYVLGDNFQTADIMIGQTLVWAFAMKTTQKYDLLAGCPALIKYLRLLSERPKMPAALKTILVERLKSL